MSYKGSQSDFFMKEDAFWYPNSPIGKVKSNLIIYIGSRPTESGNVFGGIKTSSERKGSCRPMDSEVEEQYSRFIHKEIFVAC